MPTGSNTTCLLLSAVTRTIGSEKFFYAEADQAECLSARIFAGVEKRQDQRQRGLFEPGQRILVHADAVLHGARAIAGLKVAEPNGHRDGPKALELLSL